MKAERKKKKRLKEREKREMGQRTAE